ncbi:hypothetical protein [Geminocystis sp.]
MAELKHKIDIGTQQIEEEKVIDGEIFFQQIKTELQENYGVE